MTSRPKAATAYTTSLIVILLVIVAVLGAVWLAPRVATSGSSVSRTSVGGRSCTFYSVVSSGLQIQVKLNTTKVSRGEAVAAQISIINTLGENVSMSTNSSTPSTIMGWGDYDFLCGGRSTQFSAMLGYALFSGHYTPKNISLAHAPLELAPSVGVTCVNFPPPQGIVFLPDSNAVVFKGPPSEVPVRFSFNATDISCTSIGSTVGCGGTQGLSGYWNMTTILSAADATTNSTDFVRFPPGDYTLIVQDIWNQLVFASFEVAAS